MRAGQLALEANADHYSVARNSSGNRLPLLQNDGILPANAGSWEIDGVSPCALGGIVQNTGSDVLFTPAPDFTGTESFTYWVSDGLGGTATNAVLIRVGEILLNEDCFAVLSTTNATLDVLANDGIKPIANSVTNLLGGFAASQDATVSTNNGMLVFSPGSAPATGYPYVERVTYQVADHSGLATTQHVYVLVVETGSDRSTGTVTVAINGVNDPPVLTEFGHLLETDDSAPVMPFPAAKIVDVDLWSNELQHVTIEIDDAEKGTLSPLGGFSITAAGTYEMTATAPEVSAALNGLFFVPVANRNPVGESEMATLAVSVSDPFLPAALEHRLDILVWSVNDPPVITGIVNPLNTIDDDSVHPFPLAAVSDADLGGTHEILVASVELDDPAKGWMASLGGFEQQSPTRYEMTGKPAAISTALQGLRYVLAASPLPTGTSETESFELRVIDAFVVHPATANVNLTIHGMGTYLDSWRIAYFGTDTGIATYGADPDGDGLVNIAEYAFGTDPTNWTDSAVHNLVWEGDPPTGTLIASHQRQSGDPTILYVLEKSTDMATWQNAGTWIVGSTLTPPAGGIQRSVLTIDIGSDGNCNYRIKVYY